MWIDSKWSHDPRDKLFKEDIPDTCSFWRLILYKFCYAPATKSRGRGGGFNLITPVRPFVHPNIDTWFVQLSPPENQNPVDMHTSIMCINILQNIKAVGGDSRTNHVAFMQLVRKKLLSPTRIIPISPQVIPLYLHIRNEKLKVLSVCKLSMIEHHT
jgi:hypothetical protein